MLAVGLLSAAVVGWVPPTAGADTPCEPGPVPYVGAKGADPRPEVRTSRDAEPVDYVQWSGTVPGFDGMPFSVDVAVPCGVEGPMPTVAMAHGFTDDKTVWEETGKTDTVVSEARRGSNTRWNDIWFASRGYAVLTYTARGWRDSCGPDTPGATADAPAPQCEGFESWIHLDDKRWEVRDVQWLTAGLVESGVADPGRLAITGGSYGGGPASMAAMLADQTMCGATAVPPELGADPCAGLGNGELVPWTTPDGQTPLTWAAALPLYTFADLIEVLAPNGRWSDGWSEAPRPGSPAEPFGVPLESTVSGLVLVGNLTGRFAKPGGPLDHDITTTSSRLLAGNPFPPDERIVSEGVRTYRAFKSPVTTEPQGQVPVFWVQGFTDALFNGSQALTMLNHVREADPDYPIKVFLGDIGHDYAAERIDEWDLVKAQMNDFVDHFLRPDRTPEPPTYDVAATVTRCLDGDAPLRSVSAPKWHELPRHITFSSSAVGRTSTTDIGPAGRATDPISTATLPGPESYKGCRIIEPSEPDPTTATYEFGVDRDLVLMGGPVIDLSLDITGPEVPVTVRLWDVAPDRSRQGLVTRGTYRMDEPVGRRRSVRFQLAPQGYRFEAGHTLKVEVTANDAPYTQASSIDADVTVRRMTLTVPLFGRPSADRAADGADASARATPAQRGNGPPPPPPPWFAIGGLAVLAGLVAIGVVLRARRSRAT